MVVVIIPWRRSGNSKYLETSQDNEEHGSEPDRSMSSDSGEFQQVLMESSQIDSVTETDSDSDTTTSPYLSSEESVVDEDASCRLKGVQSTTSEVQFESDWQQSLQKGECGTRSSSKEVSSKEVSQQTSASVSDKETQCNRVNEDHRRTKILEQRLQACDELVSEGIELGYNMTNNIMEYLNATLYGLGERVGNEDQGRVQSTPVSHSQPPERNISTIDRPNIENVSPIERPMDDNQEFVMSPNTESNLRELFRTNLISRLESSRDFSGFTAPLGSAVDFSGFTNNDIRIGNVREQNAGETRADNDGILNTVDILMNNVNNILCRLESATNVCRGDRALSSSTEPLVREVSDVLGSIPNIRPKIKSPERPLTQPIHVLRSRTVWGPGDDR